MDQFRSLIARAEVTTEGRLRGYAAVFDQPTTRQRDFAGTESIARGAFDNLITGDVAALVNHDPSQILGRTGSGTLKLSTDEHGLGFDLDLPDTQLGNDVRTLVQRGDYGGMSFTAAVGQMERIKGGVVHRNFSRLVDISVVTFPAYEGTSVLARNAHPNVVREQLARARARVLLGGK